MFEEAIAEAIGKIREARARQPGGKNGTGILEFGCYGALEGSEELAVGVGVGGVVRGGGKKRGRGSNTVAVLFRAWTEDRGKQKVNYSVVITN